MPLIEVPKVVTTVTRAIATNPAMNAYSNAVTPDSLRASSTIVGGSSP